MAKSKPIMTNGFNLDDPQLLKKFKKAARTYGARFGTSKDAARARLVEEGILTKTGRLTKNYSQ